VVIIAMVNAAQLGPVENVSPAVGDGAVRRRTSSGCPHANEPIDLTVVVDRVGHQIGRQIRASAPPDRDPLIVCSCNGALGDRGGPDWPNLSLGP
jgi:hypothetical protein